MRNSVLKARAASLAAILSLSLCAPARAAELIVAAATSLTHAFKELATHYAAQHPDTTIMLNFGASDMLLQQVLKGAPVDVLATADQDAMDRAAQAQRIAPGSRHDFAANRLVLIVPSTDAAAVHDLADLAAPAIRRVAIGNPALAPVGRYAKRALEAAHLWQPVAAKAVLAHNARQALDYVARGEAEAGLVFATDARTAADRVSIVQTVPLSTPPKYSIAMIASASSPRQAADFIAYVRSPSAQSVLAKYGFLKP